jgi:hypothetical protein
MVKLPDTFCPAAIEVLAALEEHRITDAKRIAREYLRQGERAQPFLNVVADLLETKPQGGKRGRRRQTIPQFWFEIGSKAIALMDQGYSEYAACQQLVEDYGDIRTIRTALKFYRKVEAAHDEIIFEELRTPRTKKKSGQLVTSR